MSFDDTFSLAIDGTEVRWFITEVSGVEAIGEPFRFVITAEVRNDAAPNPEDLITCDATLTWQCAATDPRTISGLVDEVRQREVSWEIEVVAHAALLADCVDHQIFVEQSATDVVTQVCDEHAISVDNGCVRSLEPRRQLVQVFESDLAFITRLLAQEGIVWWCHPSQAGTIVLAGEPGDFPELPVDVFAAIEQVGMHADHSVQRLRFCQTVCSDKVTLRDYHFEAPRLDLSASHEADDSGGRLERYHYRAHYTSTDQGKQIAERQLSGYRARHAVLKGSSYSRCLQVGHVIEVDAAGSEMNGKWLLVRVEHSADSRREHPYEARFEAVVADDGFRQPAAAENKLGSVQTMVVTGPSGSEIHPDATSRVRAHFRWDRRLPFDDTSSNWMRVVQPPASGGVMLPRTGWEVLSTFWGPFGTDPTQLGRLYNGASPPPNALPGDKVVTAFGSQTSPGGGGGNLVAFNDTAGDEMMSFVASKDFNERTENDKMTGVKANDSSDVGGTRTITIGKVCGVAGGGAQSRTVTANRTVNVAANKTINAASETVAIGGARIFDVGGDHATESASLIRAVGAAKTEACIEHHSLLVTGVMTTMIGGSWGQKSGLTHDVSVGGANKEEVGGAKSLKASKYELKVTGPMTETYAARKIKAGGNLVYDYGAKGTLDIGGSATMKGADVVFEATGKITLKAGGLKITITGSSVTVDGDYKSSAGADDDSNETYG